MRIAVSVIESLRSDYSVKYLKDIIKPGMKVVCIPWASELSWVLKGPTPDDFIYKHYRPFYEYGIELEDFYVCQAKDSIRFIKMKLNQADIIYFSGGYMECLLNLLYLTGLDTIIKDMKDKIVIGESAGALVLSDYYYEYPYGDEYSKIKRREGLGLINDHRFIVHYTEDMDLDSILLESYNDPLANFIALTDSEICIINNKDTLIVNVSNGKTIKF